MQEYNNCMQKPKIIITGLLLYEFVMITLLQISDYCNAVFNVKFCLMGTFKYFMLCIMVPVFVWLIIWWIPTISGIVCPNKCKCENQTKTDVIPKEIQNLVMATIIFGIKKFLEYRQKNKNRNS